MSLLSVADAQARLLGLACALPLESVPLVDAVGRWAGEDVMALRHQPATDLSAMDGYAIRFDDLPGPWTLIGESAAGQRFAGMVGAGECVRIFTGAALPEGADTILIQEEVAADGATIRLTGDAPDRCGLHVRGRGGDFAQGAVVIAAGEKLTPAHVALAAMAGHGALKVARRVRVALISTGNELVAPGDPVGPDQLPGSNGVMLRALLAGLPCDVVDGGIIRDELPAIEAAIRAVAGVDIIVTTGGASVGDHDLVRPALVAAGAVLDFYKVAMKPGKPLMAGRLGDALVLGLPGNPVSAFATATLFLKPLVAAMAGAAMPLPQMVELPLGQALTPVGQRAEFLRAHWDGRTVTALSTQDSGAVRALAQANALICRPVHDGPVAAGALVGCLLL
jgi:molybdopterin molybdotransferase